MSSTKPVPLPRSAYRHFLPITTRWMDNDVYGHVNNVVYYSYFDTVVNEYLIRRGALDVCLLYKTPSPRDLATGSIPF